MVSILLFGPFAERAGTRQIEINIKTQGSSVEKIIEIVTKDYFKGELFLPYLICVNEKTVDMSYKIMEGDEVALMPPFSGG